MRIFLRRVAAPEFSRRLKPIGIYTRSGFPESHHRQVVDGSILTYRTHKNTPESHHLPVVGLRGIFPALGRQGMNDPPAPAGGIRLNIICVDTSESSSWSLVFDLYCGQGEF